MTQTSRLSKNNTRVVHDGLGMAVILYDTVIVRMKLDGTVTLDSGGWTTVTTKTRMNQFANQYCQGRFGVFRVKGEWFVSIRRGRQQEERIPFEDGMEFKL